jgi:hypothetical protein
LLHAALLSVALMSLQNDSAHARAMAAAAAKIKIDAGMKDHDHCAQISPSEHVAGNRS